MFKGGKSLHRASIYLSTNTFVSGPIREIFDWISTHFWPTPFISLRLQSESSAEYTCLVLPEDACANFLLQPNDLGQARSERFESSVLCDLQMGIYTNIYQWPFWSNKGADKTVAFLQALNASMRQCVNARFPSGFSYHGCLSRYSKFPIWLLLKWMPNQVQ